MWKKISYDFTKERKENRTEQNKRSEQDIPLLYSWRKDIPFTGYTYYYILYCDIVNCKFWIISYIHKHIRCFVCKFWMISQLDQNPIFRIKLCSWSPRLIATWQHLYPQPPPYQYWFMVRLTRCFTQRWILVKTTHIIPFPKLAFKVVRGTVLITSIIWVILRPIRITISSGRKRYPMSFFTNIRIVNPIPNWKILKCIDCIYICVNFIQTQDLAWCTKFKCI